MRECIFEVNPEGLGRWSEVCSFYHFADSDLKVEIFFEKEGTAERGHWFCNGGYRHLCTFVLWVEGNFMRRLSVLFLLLFGDKNVACKSSPDLYFYPLIIKSFWFAKLQLKIAEKIHTKANADVSRDPGERVFLGWLGGER